MEIDEFRCHNCKVCLGTGCLDELPGMGGVNKNENFRLNVSAWDRLYAEEGEGKVPELSEEEILSLLRYAPVTGAVENIGWEDEEDFYYDFFVAVHKAGVKLSLGDGTPDSKLLYGINAIKEMQKQYGKNYKAAVFLKPYPDENLTNRIAWVMPVASHIGIDIDAYNIVTMRNKVHLEKKDESSLRELKALANSKGRPFAIKGIFTDEDIDLVKKIKPDIALVSNHGGRVPQRHGSTAQFLADFHKILLENSGEVWVDGGIRNQDQIQKAFSYGVKEVLIGRPFVSAILKKQKI